MSRLIVVPTPIGNLEDITLRALNVLKRVDFILAEDTRVSRVLLKHYEIENKLIPYHQHNEHKQLNQFIEKIKQTQEVALVSDAGTPAISDPGFLLVRKCIENDIEVECLPGATAFVPALVISGIPNNNFVFEGFLPHKKGRQTKLHQIRDEKRTVVIYESCHRIEKLLKELEEVLAPSRQVAVCKEISKKFETVHRGEITQLKSQISDKNLKGEFVVVIEGDVKK
jgi:16S rRNA (cytidine1402-2'-O)-methyltransferase